MSAIIGSIVAFIVAGLAIFGLVPHQQIQPVPQITQDNIAPIVQQAVVPPSTTRNLLEPIHDTPETKPSTTQTYINSRYGYRVQYPTDIVFTPDDGPGLGYTSAVDFTYQGNRYYEGKVSIMILKDMPKCLVVPAISQSFYGNSATTTIDGVSFLTYTVADALIGEYRSWLRYQTPFQGLCLLIQKTTIVFSNTDWTEDEQIASQKEVQKANAKLDSIIRSFQFTR